MLENPKIVLQTNIRDLIIIKNQLFQTGHPIKSSFFNDLNFIIAHINFP